MGLESAFSKFWMALGGFWMVFSGLLVFFALVSLCRGWNMAAFQQE